MMKVVVDRDRCVGHALCESFAPEVFEIDDAGDLQLIADEVPDDLHEAVGQAIASCPVEALSWGD